MTDDFILNNFTSGQIGQKLIDRVDLANYHSGVEQMTNFIPLPHGGVTNRTGTKFHYECKSGITSAPKLIPFKASSTSAFMLEVGTAYIRFHKVGSPNAVVLSSGSPYEVTTTYASLAHEELDYAQSNDYMYMAHKSYVIKQLARVSDTNWVFSSFINKDGPFLSQNTTVTTMKPNALIGDTAILPSDTVFTSNDIGRLIRVRHQGVWGTAKITSLGAGTANVTVDTEYPFNGTTVSKNWTLGAWSNFRGYPGNVTFHEGRLFFAGNNTQPQTVWGSVSDDYDTFSPSLPNPDSADDTPKYIVTDEAALNLTLASNEVNYIKWIYSGNNLFVGTDTGIFPISSGNTDDPLTSTTARARRKTAIGSSSVKPLQANNNLLFVDRSGLKIIELLFDEAFNDYTTNDVTRLIDDVLVNPVKQMAFARSPYRTVWVVSAGGELTSFTYFPEEKVVGWATHTIAGDNVRVESVAVLPSADGSYDEVWLVVRREINNVGKYYIETLDQWRIDSRFATLKSQYIYLDCAKTYSGSAATTITGLDHLNGETVQVVADGNYIGDKVVSSNQITLTTAASVVHVGYRYDSTIKTLPIEVPTQKITSLGKTRRVTHFDISLYRTLGLKYGNSLSNLYELPFRNMTDPMDSSPPLFTGKKKDNQFPGGMNDDQIYLVQDKPYPCTIRSIIFKAVIAK